MKPLSQIIHSLRKPVETERMQHLDPFRTIFDKSHDGILLLENGLFIDCNEAIIRILGYESKEDVLNLHPEQLSPEFQPDGRSSFEKSQEMMKIGNVKNFL